MANWTDLSTAFGYGTKLTSQQQQQLRDNVTALAEGASGAPVVEVVNIFAPVAEVTGITNTSWTDIYRGYYKHQAGISQAAFSAYIKNTPGSDQIQARLNIGGQTGANATRSNTTYNLETGGAVDVSGLTPGTIYSFAVQVSMDTGETGSIFGYKIEFS